MKKGVVVCAHIYVEGDAPPPEDFAAIGQRVVSQVLRLGSQNVPGYQVTVRKLWVDDDPPDEDVADDHAPADRAPADRAPAAPPEKSPAAPPALRGRARE